MFATRDYRQLILSEAAHGGLPVAYWPMQTTQGTIEIDLAAAVLGVSDGQNGTYAGGYTLGQDYTSVGVGVTTNGSSGYLFRNASPIGSSPSAFTLELFARVADPLQTRYAICLGSSSSIQPLISINTASSGTASVRAFPTLFMRNDAGTNVVSIGSSIAAFDGNLHHIAATFDGSIARMYVDGFLAATSGSVSLGTTTLNRLAVGARLRSGVDAYCAGTYRHVAIYNYAMRADRIGIHAMAAVTDGPFEVPVMFDLPDAIDAFTPSNPPSIAKTVALLEAA